MLWLALIFGCGGDGGSVPVDSASTTTAVLGGTPGTGTLGGTPSGSRTLAASCAVDAENGLRVWCDIELPTAGGTSVTLSGAGVPTRTVSSEQDGVTHEQLVWGLKPDTTYDWEAEGLSGTVTTGSLPPQLGAMTVDRTGALAHADALLLPVSCSGLQAFAMFDGDGDIVWYEPSSVFQNNMDGYDWSSEDRSILVTSGSVVEEITLAGDRPLSLAGYEGRAHHDLARWNGYTYVLVDYLVNDMMVDGIHVYDGTTLVDTFRLEDHFAIEGTPVFGNDWSHANAINPTADGHIALSVLAFDSVLLVDMDPNSPTFKDILWIASGSGDGLPGTTYQAPEGLPEGWDRQHNSSVDGDVLTLFDNSGDPAGARAARYRLDPVSGQALHVQSWSMGTLCPVQGGAIPLADTVVASCPATREIAQFTTGTATPTFTMHALCDGGLQSGAINRAIPVAYD